ncbi:hypothetical protein GQF01_14170 [Paenibacillus sp. 5J-6]|uniref:rhamnogalacturonan endolyase n=1 Tax=Paenibacillus silvestris TaxID=2606219 RepID=A0A6L8UZ54_9BACL|nr:polysaccharide lyase family protein [Paenibacillus silvestris]MZQ83257.1 hypothetical protein [Paenibacillus silvestris]
MVKLKLSFALLLALILSFALVQLSALAADGEADETVATVLSNDVVLNKSPGIANTWRLSNGTLSMDISTTNGQISNVKINGSASLSAPSYPFTITNNIDSFTVTKVTDVLDTADEVHIALTYAYTTATQRFKAERHFVMRRGVNGLYDYVILSTPEQRGGAAEVRTLYGFKHDLLPNGYNSEMNQEIPLWKPVVQDTTWKDPNSDTIYSKYDFVGYHAENPLVGHYGDNYGAWMINASSEYFSGGPLKQELLVHGDDALILNYFTGGHMGGANMDPPNGWQKIHGPWLIYFNDAASVDGGDLIADAKRQAAEEKAKWPYNFVTDTSNTPGLYPKADERATVTGKLETSDGRDLGGAMVILSEPGVEVIRQVNGYYFYAYADADGNFSIPNVRPGDYTLYVFPQHGSIIGQLEHEGVNITASDGGIKKELGTLSWSPTIDNNYLFQIGKASHSTVGFRGSDEKRNYSLMRDAPANLTYNVNTSVTKDWYYAQVKTETVGSSPNIWTSTANAFGAWPGTGPWAETGAWKIDFNSTKAYTGDAHLRIAFAAVSNQPILEIKVNGTVVKVLNYVGKNDQTIYRSANRSGRYLSEDIIFDASLLTNGTNTITITNKSRDLIIDTNPPPFYRGSVMYDTIMLTTDEQGNIDSLKQLVNSGKGAGDITATAVTALHNYLDTNAANFSSALAGFISLLDTQNVGSDYKELLTISARNVANGSGINKTTLKELVSTASSFDESDYNSENWDSFTKALSAANAVMANTGATQNTVYAARNNLQQAMDHLSRAVPPVEGYKGLYYTDFEDDSLWGFDRTEPGHIFAQVDNVDIDGNTNKKFQLYANNVVNLAMRKALPKPVDNDKMMVVFDWYPAPPRNNSAAKSAELRLLDGNGDILVALTNRHNTNLGAYTQLNRPKNNYTSVKNTTFSDKLAWYTVTVLVDKTAKKITVTYKNKATSAEQSLEFVYDPTKNDGTIAFLDVVILSEDTTGQVMTTYLDSIAVYEAGTETAAASLTGPASVVPGTPFDLNFNISAVSESVYQEVYAQDLTIQFDPNVLTFVKAKALTEGLEVIESKELSPGNIRFLTAALVKDQVTPPNGNFVSFTFVAKPNAGPVKAEVAVGNVIIANSMGQELHVPGSSFSFNVQNQPVDTAALQTLISLAQSKVNAAVEGKADGQYVAGSKAILQTVINQAQTVVNQALVTQQQIDQAVTNLTLAITAFESSRISTDVNGDVKVTIGDLAIVAAGYGKKSTDSDWNQFKAGDVSKDGLIDIDDLTAVAMKILE